MEIGFKASRTKRGYRVFDNPDAERRYTVIMDDGSLIGFDGGGGCVVEAGDVYESSVVDSIARYVHYNGDSLGKQLRRGIPGFVGRYVKGRKKKSPERAVAAERAVVVTAIDEARSRGVEVTMSKGDMERALGLCPFSGGADEALTSRCTRDVPGGPDYMRCETCRVAAEWEEAYG